MTLRATVFGVVVDIVVWWQALRIVSVLVECALESNQYALNVTQKQERYDRSVTTG